MMMLINCFWETVELWIATLYFTKELLSDSLTILTLWPYILDALLKIVSLTPLSLCWIPSNFIEPFPPRDVEYIEHPPTTLQKIKDIFAGEQRTKKK